MRARLALLGALVLAACVPTARPSLMPTVPPPLRFDGPPAPTAPYANAALARDILDLSFALEDGTALPALTRFEGPVTVGVERGTPALHAELDALLRRLRAEARLDVTRAAPGEAASITVSAVPRAAIGRVVPDAACFVVPRASGWDDFRARRRTPAMDWRTLDARRRATVVVPVDAAPQDLRDCLHEEVAQALGPLGDLYRLEGSVFDDDDLHAVLTDRDMAVLRALYDPALRSGMTRAEVAARLPAILFRTNPAGRRADPGPVAPDTAAWGAAIRTALSGGASGRARLAAAREAVARADAAAWTDERPALSRLALGRAALGLDADRALRAFRAAAARFALGTTGRAQAQMHLAAFALAAANPAGAERIARAAEPVARGAQQAGLLATLLLIRAEAEAAQGRATATQAEALAWGRYAWGDVEAARRAAEVAALAAAS